MKINRVKRAFLKDLSIGLVIAMLVPLCACSKTAPSPASTPSPTPVTIPAPTTLPSPTPAPPIPTPTTSETPIQTLPAKIEVGLLSISPATVPVNQPVTILIDVSNSGGTEGACSLTMMVDGAKVQTKVIMVAPESTEQVSFEHVAEKSGIHEVKINGVSGTFQVVEPADLTASTLVVTPTVAEIGQTVTATVGISNSGEIEGSYPVTLKVAGVQIENKVISVPPGVTEKARFTFNRDTPGCYQIEAAGLTGFLIVIEPGGTTVGLLETSWPEVFQELQLLPELEEIDMKDNEAIEDIAYLSLNPQYRAAFESMLTVGIKGQREYCTPLQALLWIAYDREFDNTSANPLVNYSLEKLINDAWENTTESGSYNSYRWQNFDEVVERLNFPIGIARYIKENFSYFYRSILRPPAETFGEKGGACSNWGMFSSFCLLKNGFEYDDFEIHGTNAACTLLAYEGSYFGAVREGQGIKGHVVTLYIQDDLFYLIDMGKIRGPFNTIEDAVNETYTNWDAYELRDINAKLTKKVKRTN